MMIRAFAEAVNPQVPGRVACFFYLGNRCIVPMAGLTSHGEDSITRAIRPRIDEVEGLRFWYPANFAILPK